MELLASDVVHGKGVCSGLTLPSVVSFEGKSETVRDMMEKLSSNGILSAPLRKGKQKKKKKNGNILSRVDMIVEYLTRLPYFFWIFFAFQRHESGNELIFFSWKGGEKKLEKKNTGHFSTCSPIPNPTTFFFFLFFFLVDETGVVSGHVDLLDLAGFLVGAQVTHKDKSIKELLGHPIAEVEGMTANGAAQCNLNEDVLRRLRYG